MLRLFLTLWLSITPAFAWAGPVPLLGAGSASGGGAGPFALDGTPVAGNSSSASNPVLTGFSTTFSNDVVVLAGFTNGTAFTSPFTTGGLTFTQEPSLTPPATGGSTVQIFTAIASSPISAGTSFTLPNSGAFTTYIMFALSGAKTSAPFSASGPLTSTGAGGTGLSAKISASETVNIFAFGLGVAGSNNLTGTYTIMNPAIGGGSALSNVLELGYKFTTGPLSNDTWDGGSILSIGTAIVTGP